VSTHASSAPRLAAPALSLRTARLTAFCALAGFAAAQWGRLVVPGAGGRLVVVVVLVAGATCWASARIGALGPAGRLAASLALLVALAGAVLVGAGVPTRLLSPGAWPDVTSGLSQGISGLPDANVPYDGADDWVRIVILSGGCVLVALGALLAFGPRPVARSPLPAAAVLGVLYAVPVIERNPRLPYLGGAVFALLLAAFLWLEYVERDHFALAAVLTLLAAAFAAVLAPAFDRSRPLVDYQHLASSLTASGTSTYDWNHRYGPLDWPRRGKELLRIRASTRGTYWKAADLDSFDGKRWYHSDNVEVSGRDTAIAAGHPDWIQSLVVTVRGLHSVQFVTAGTALSVDRFTQVPIRDTPATFVTGRVALHPGDSYRATVYTARPTTAEMAGAGTRYPAFVDPYLTMALPHNVGGPVVRDPETGRPSDRLTTEILFDGWGRGARAVANNRYVPTSGVTLLERSRYARMYRLARRLRAQSSSPLDFVRRVERRVDAGATYSEDPPARPLPLDAFLFRDHLGYCQQFSGAMALLLRMGGVPARVAAGFAPGRYDRARREYVVTDFDAHSWVEVYFPGYGWATFDPTPAIAPPRSQAASFAGATPAPSGVRGRGGAGEAVSGRTPASSAGGGGGGWVVVVTVAFFLGLGVLSVVRLERRGRPPGPPVAHELAELHRALHRTGRTPFPGATLLRLETILGGRDAAAEYLRAVRDARYAGSAGRPTPVQRRALRAELGAGLGAMGRLRAWWALPPRLRRGPTLGRDGERV